MKTFRIALLTCCFAGTAWADDIPALWKAKCASCHGEDGKAQTKTGKKEKVNDMTNPDWQTNWTDEKMKKVIVEGSKDNTKMKAFGCPDGAPKTCKAKIPDAEIDGLIKHIRAFKG